VCWVGYLVVGWLSRGAGLRPLFILSYEWEGPRGIHYPFVVDDEWILTYYIRTKREAYVIYFIYLLAVSTRATLRETPKMQLSW
jgi:hypothetical protein